jgi:DNA methyltransferase 1-associated protein 1
MPTRDNLLHLESLIEATTLLLETKKNVDRVEQEIKNMKGKAAVRKREEEHGGEEGGEVAMDVDQDAVGDEDDMGIHPGRGTRKKNVSIFPRLNGAEYLGAG